MNLVKAKTSSANAIILFDGVCNVCAASVQFILLRDKSGYFKFASLQSNIGQKILAERNLNTSCFDSVVLIENNKLYERSDAALRIARKLSGAWKLFYVLILMPKFFRDAVYNFIANNRYRWFGKKEECLLPKPEWKQRFLND